MTERYDLSRPELLKVHAIIARIFHASGTAEQVDKAFRDLVEQCVLANDGRTDISSMKIRIIRYLKTYRVNP